MAKLNVFGRQLLVARIEQEGWPAAQAAEAQGVSRATAYKWVLGPAHPSVDTRLRLRLSARAIPVAVRLAVTTERTR
jgi:hypothetical protein